MIIKIQNWPEVPFWEEIAAKNSQCTFFHTPLWHEIVVSSYRDYAITTKGFVFEDGTRAVFPLIKKKSGGILKGKTRLKSSVFGGYGGIISEKKLTQQQQDQIHRHLLSLHASLSIDGNPFSSYTVPDTFNKRKDFTQVFTLGSEDELVGRLSRGAKSNLNQARKKGVSIRTAQNEEDVRAYYMIYQDTLKRWGEATLLVYPEKLFMNIFSKQGDSVKIWLAEIDQTIIAGAVIFYWNQVVSYWHGAALKDYLDCYPNNLLHMEIIKDACHKDFRYYDFGPSGGQDGVVRFKKSFGAEKREFLSGHRKYRWLKRS
jgi:hypothetical protein